MKTMPVLRIASIVVAVYLAAGHTQAGELRHEVEEAIGKLAEQDSYRWTSVRKSVGEDARSVKGKIRKDGLSQVVIETDGNAVEGVLQGKKGALKAEGNWKSTSAFTGSGGSPGGNPMTFLARHLSTFGKSPVVQARGLMKQTKDLVSDGAGVYSGLLTDEGVTHNVPRFGVEVSDTKGSIKFHVKDGMLVRYRYSVLAHVKFVEQKREVDYNRTTTVRIRGVGKTRLNVPAEALKSIE